MMFHVPQMYDTHSYLREFENDKLRVCKEESVFEDINIPCDEDLSELCKIIMQENHLTAPKDPFEATNMYIELRNHLLNEL